MELSTVIDDVYAADEARYQALYAQDVETLAGMLHEDYVHTHANGSTDDKHAFLVSIKESKYRFVRAERSAQQIRLCGSSAILHGQTRTTLATRDGEKVLRNAFVTIWNKEDGSWKLRHWQATPLLQ